MPRLRGDAVDATLAGMAGAAEAGPVPPPSQGVAASRKRSISSWVL
ncbi:MAG: hypothetical protein K6U87_08265 [Firmicutes bacterium]|nr:hypothetical protein [Bacillota bacterium]